MRHCVRQKIRKPEITKGLITALINHKEIKTTLSRAKKIRSVFEKLITKGIKALVAREKQESDLARMRLLASELGNYKLAKKLVDEICTIVKDRPGGYTRILKFSRLRMGDSAQPAIISLVRED
jgi:large subunit ribosomal protein L17